MIDDQLTSRINELESLLGEIQSSYAWQLAKKELNNKIELLNDTWQNALPEEILNLQVSKLAIMEISLIEEEWASELAQLKNKLQEEQNPDLIQPGDFDNE